MINEITVHPKPQNNNAKIVSLAAMVLAVACVVLYSFMDKYRGIVGVVAIMFITTAVLIYTKYVSIDFYYDITVDPEGIPLFVVRQITGKRQTTLCCIEFWNVESVNYMSAKERREHKRDANVRKYVYSPTLFPKETYMITVRTRYERCEITVECSDEFAEHLRAVTAEAKTMKAEDDEE